MDSRRIGRNEFASELAYLIDGMIPRLLAIPIVCVFAEGLIAHCARCYARITKGIDYRNREDARDNGKDKDREEERHQDDRDTDDSHNRFAKPRSRSHRDLNYAHDGMRFRGLRQLPIGEFFQLTIAQVTAMTATAVAVRHYVIPLYSTIQ